jgi:hypothetical protein
LSYRIDPAARIVEISGPDGASPAAFQRILRAILIDPDYRSGFGFFRDRRGFRLPPTGLVQGVASVIRETDALAGSRWAIVVSDPANYGMMRMLSILSDVAVMEIFEDPIAATGWLAGAGD